MSAKALEAAGGVPERQTGHGARVNVGAVAEHEPAHRPVHHGHLAVAYRDPRTRSASWMACRNSGRCAGIVREVGVHLEDVLVIALERPAEAGDVGGAQAHLPAPAGGGERASSAAMMLVDDLPRPVRRAVVDDQHVERRILREDRRNQAGNVVAFVVGRDDHEGAIRQLVSGRARFPMPSIEKPECDCEPGDHFPALVRRACESQIDAARSRRQLHADKGVVGSANGVPACRPRLRCQPG